MEEISREMNGIKKDEIKNNIMKKLENLALPENEV